MKFSFNIVTPLVLFVVFFVGCQKDERLMYEEDPRIYFYKNVRGSQINVDSVEYSFATQPAIKVVDTVYMQVRIIGLAAAKDRIINIVADSGTAKMGYHYTLGPLVMPANAYETKIPVYLFRRPGLKDSLVSVVFSIQESADFKPGFPDNPRTFYKYDRLHYKVGVTDKLLKPANWETVWINSFGSYSEVKFRFLIQATGVTNWNSSPLPQNQRYMVQQARLALLEYNQLNGDLIDEFGQVVIFP